MEWQLYGSGPLHARLEAMHVGWQLQPPEEREGQMFALYNLRLAVDALRGQ